MGISRVLSNFGKLSVLVLALCVLSGGAQAVTPVKHRKHVAKTAANGHVHSTKAVVTHSRATGTVHVAASRHHGRTLTARSRRHVWVQTWDEPTYANSTAGDNIEGEDLNIRRAAVDALGPYNGSVVVADPNTGRILTIVNQKLALGAGFQPCSTIKLTVALAGLKENLVQQPGILRVARRNSMDLTQAIARSNNFYFATLGQKLGYERVAYYAREFGYGEKAGWNIAGEQPGYFPPAPPKNGGVGMLTSFGEEIQQTPLELAALVSAIANGGKLYYLQYPHTPDEIKSFQPKLKRTLEIGPYIASIKPGMQGAVEFGTARRAKQDEPILGKTGTCSQGRTRLGWFGSFNDVGSNKLVVVVMLTGGRPSIGPMAAGVAGDVYRNLAQAKVLSLDNKTFRPESLVATQICCGGH
jgi:cell division protein FtsI/penicillin-binding protein 2